MTTTASGTTILETPDTRQTCEQPQLLSAFASFGDMRDYVLAPGGSFESKDLDGWQVSKAKTAGGGSPLVVQDADDNKRSLRIPAGGSATSPAMCVDLHYPTFRLMTKAHQSKGQLRVELVYPDSDNPVFQPVGSLAADGKEWQASADMPVFPERGGAAPGCVEWRFASPRSQATETPASGASTTSTSTPDAASKRAAPPEPSQSTRPDHGRVRPLRHGLCSGSEGGCGGLPDLVKRKSRASRSLLQRHVRPLEVQREPCVRKQLGGHRRPAGVDWLIVTQSVRERDQLIRARPDLTATHQAVKLGRLFVRLAQDCFEVLGQPNPLSCTAELSGTQRQLGARSRIVAVGELLVEAVASQPRPQP